LNKGLTIRKTADSRIETLILNNVENVENVESVENVENVENVV